MKKIIIILLISAALSSCYIKPETGYGKAAVNIQTDIMKTPPPGYEAELVLRLFNEGDFSVNQDVFGIEYLTEYADTENINGRNSITIPVNGGTGQIELDEIPAEKPLNLLVEYYGDGVMDSYYLAYAGLSDAFEVEDGGTVAIDVALSETVAGTLVVNKRTGFNGIDFMRGYTPEDMASYFYLDTPSAGEMMLNSSPEVYLFESTAPEDSAVSMTFTEDAIPGKKLRILVSNSSLPPFYGEYYGISGEFEVLPEGLHQFR